MHPWGSPLKLGYIYSPFVGRSVPVPTLRAGCPQDPIQNASNAPATKSTPTGVLENPKCSKWETSLQIFHINHIKVCVCVCVCVLFAQSCLTLCNPVNPPGSFVHEIPQARILEWVAISSSRGSSKPRHRICGSYISCIGRWNFYH